MPPKAKMSFNGGLVSLPPHLVQPHRVLEPTQRDIAVVREQEPLAGYQVAHTIGDENLPRLGLGTDAGRQLDGGAEEVLIFGDGLSRIEADADV
jgi:hypothetical protein